MFFALVLLLSSVGIAHAEDVAAAREHFQRGSTAYDLGRFLDAAHEYEAAYEAKPDPSLLFNIGQSYRFAAEYQKAILAFKSFLRRVPDAPNRTEVEARLTEMQQLLQAQRRLPEQPPKASIAAAPTERGAEPRPGAVAEPPLVAHRATPSGRSLVIAGAVTGAVGIALVATGGAFVAQTRAAGDAVNRPQPGTPFSPSLVDTLNRDQTLETVFLAVGGAALLTGAAVAIVGARRLHAERKLSWAPFGSPSSAGIALAGAW